MLLVCWTCTGVIGYAQSTYQFGLLPAVNLNKKLKKDWKFNLKIESRQSLKDGLIGESGDFDYDYVLTDFAFVLSKKVGLNNTLAGGYMIRFRDNDLYHRFIQQFTIVQRFSNFRLGHRLSADQTFSTADASEYRFRYRATVQLPLNGASIDPQEFYLKVNNEYLNAFSQSEYDLEIRLIPFLGYGFTDANKLELGVDYRLDSFLNSDPRNRFWLSMNWYLSF